MGVGAVLDAVVGEFHEGLFQRRLLEGQFVDGDAVGGGEIADAVGGQARDGEFAGCRAGRGGAGGGEQGGQALRVGERTRTVLCPAAAMTASTLSSASSRPRPITTRCSAVRAISLIRWEDTNTVRPSAARERSRFRIHKMPSGSKPLMGSSRIKMAGSPNKAAASPRRCPIPSENPPARLDATAVRPTRSKTATTRPRSMPLASARPPRWFWALRPGWNAFGSNRAPTSNNGRRWSENGRPLISADPDVGLSRPRIRRRVVDLPAPLGPRNPVTTPGCTSKLRSSTATVGP